MHESFLCTFKRHFLLGLADCEIFVQVKTAMTAVISDNMSKCGQHNENFM